MSRPYIIGGMGDVLLSLEDALREKDVTLYSHSEEAPKLLTPYGIRVHSEHFVDPSQVVISGRALPRRQYPTFPIPESSLARARALPVRSRVVGLHPIGSVFSRRVAERRGAPPKRLPTELVMRLAEALDDGDTTCLLFCGPGERAEFEISRNNVTVVAEPNPWDALACVTLCHRVVGVDSVIKTMSALRRIPTVVLLGDHRDRYRDRYFINPYVRDGVMHVIRFTDPADIDVSNVASIVRSWEECPRAPAGRFRRALRWWFRSGEC